MFNTLKQMGHSAIGTYQTIIEKKKAFEAAKEKGNSDLFKLSYHVAKLKETLSSRFLGTRSAKETQTLLVGAKEQVADYQKQLGAITEAVSDALWAYENVSGIVAADLNTAAVNRDLRELEHFIAVLEHCLKQVEEEC